MDSSLPTTPTTAARTDRLSFRAKVALVWIAIFACIILFLSVGPQMTDLAPILCLALSQQFSKNRMILAGTEGSGLFISSGNRTVWTRLGESLISGPVNAVLLAADFPVQPDILALQGDSLLVSRDAGRSWSRELASDAGFCSVAAPTGIKAGSSVLLGQTDGKVIQVSLS